MPEDSPCFKMVEKGDRAGLEELFSMHKASPFDINPGGRSLLHVSLLLIDQIFEYSRFCIDD